MNLPISPQRRRLLTAATLGSLAWPLAAARAAASPPTGAPAILRERPGPGHRWPAERVVSRDPRSGTTVTRLTGYHGHSHHLYFTDKGWIDGGRKLLVVSDRHGANNLFAVELGDGTLTQLTAFPASEHPLYSVTVNPRRAEVAFWRARDVLALDLASLVVRPVWRCPDGFDPQQLTVDADGATLYTGLVESGPRGEAAYEGYRERFASRPLSRVVMLALDGGTAQTLHEERAWITHVNASPEVPGRVVFCHEGPWDAVQRMWALDARTGRVWALRPRDGFAGIGHEYWLSGGRRLGYHYRVIGNDRRHFLGFIDWEDRSPREVEIPVPTQHSHANDEGLVVMDSVRSAGDWILLAVREGEGYAAPRLLCLHGTSRHHHRAHAHPRLSPDGTRVVFTTDRSGYCQVHVAEIPAKPLHLPAYDGPPPRFYWM